MTNTDITSDSLEKLNFIKREMEGSTFHTHIHILYDIASLLNVKDITYLEIGAFSGASASLMSMNPKVKKCYSIDIGYPTDKNVAIRNVNKFKHSHCEYDYIQGDSCSIEVIERIYNTIKNVDILFIDGDHDYQPVIDDFMNYKKLVNPGGYIIFDDYLDSGCPQVKRAVDDLVSNELHGSYEIIGSLQYDLLEKTNNNNLGGSNEFIIKKIN